MRRAPAAGGGGEVSSGARPRRGTLPRLLLRVEGLAVLAGALVLYFELDYGIVALIVFALAPDLSLLGYLRGPAAGALTYNLAHTYAGPLALAVGALLADADVALQAALIWAAHIGLDRTIGYGLKYPGAFKETHLQRV